MKKVTRVIRNSKVRNFFLLCALISSPILAIANVKSEIIKKSKTISSNQNIQRNLNEQDIRQLNREGAISTKEAEKLIKDLSVKEYNGNNNSQSIENISKDKNLNTKMKITNIRVIKPKDRKIIFLNGKRI